jgi:hypothetical protein
MAGLNILTALAYLTSRSVYALYTSLHSSPTALNTFAFPAFFPHSLSIQHTALAQQFNHTNLPFRFFNHTDDDLKPTLYGFYGAQFVKDLHCNLTLHFPTMALVSECTNCVMPLHQLQFHSPSENCLSHLAQERPILKLEIFITFILKW